MKQVGDTVYVHKSNVRELPDWANARYTHAVNYINNWEWDIVSVNKNKISFVHCPEFNSIFEPTVGDRLTLEFNEGSMRVIKASTKNPQIYHRRHLFVSPDYTGFNVQEDIERVKSWEQHNPETNKMGRRLWWEQFLETHNLEKNF